MRWYFIKISYVVCFIFSDIFDYVEKNGLDDLSQNLSTSDQTCKDKIRCHCFIMTSGLCRRINTVPMFMETNRLVSARFGFK